MAFKGCSSLASVVIPNSVNVISDYMFDGCSSLASVEIPNTVQIIGEHAFSGCSSLEGIALPGTVRSLGDFMLSGCTSLTGISIPGSVTHVGSRIFEMCSSLTSIKVDAGNAVYDSRKDCNAIIETGNNALIAGCQGTIIPNTVTTVAKYAFAGCAGLSKVEMPNSVTSIEEGAFRSCSELADIVIPNSVTSIGKSVLAECPNLSSIKVTWARPITDVDGAFDEVFSSATLYVPKGTSMLYMAIPEWMNFENIMEYSDDSPDDPKPLKGDMNGDGVVDVTDIAILANIILHGSETGE